MITQVSSHSLYREQNRLKYPAAPSSVSFFIAHTFMKVKDERGFPGEPCFSNREHLLPFHLIRLFSTPLSSTASSQRVEYRLSCVKSPWQDMQIHHSPPTMEPVNQLDWLYLYTLDFLLKMSHFLGAAVLLKHFSLKLLDSSICHRANHRP